MVTVIEVFNPIWLGTALFNMGMGVVRAGHSVDEEFSIFLVTVVITAAVALLICRKSL